MQNSNKNIIIGIVAVAFLMGGAWWFLHGAANPLPIAEGDTVASWDIQGIYKDGGELEKKANDEIARQKSLLGGDQSGKNDDPTDYILYVGIANQYMLLGDGKSAYEYLGRALQIDPTKTGLAWYDLGVLLEKVGAFNTARIAYARAVEAQPQVEQYHIARIQFLMSKFSEDRAALQAAFEEAEARFGKEAPFLLQLKAQAKL